MDDFKKKAATKEWSCHATPPSPKHKRLNKTLRARLKADLARGVYQDRDQSEEAYDVLECLEEVIKVLWQTPGMQVQALRLEECVKQLKILMPFVKDIP